MVHGIEGLNRSAAVLMAFLMSNTTCILEDVFIYMKYLRPHLSVSKIECMSLTTYQNNFHGFHAYKWNLFVIKFSIQI